MSRDLEDDAFYSSSIMSENVKPPSVRESWLQTFAQAFATCKFNKIKGMLDSTQVSSTFLLSQLKQVVDAEKMFMQMRFHAPQSRLLFFHSSKEPSTAAVFNGIVQAANQPGIALEDVDVLGDLAKYATFRLAFIEFLASLAEDHSTKSIQVALKMLSSASVVAPMSSLLPIFDRIRAEFKALYHTFETLQLINNLRYIDALIALQQAFARLEELESRTGMSTSSNTGASGSTSGTACEPWQRFYIWLRGALSHFVGKFCAFFYTAIGPYMVPEGWTNALSTNAFPGLLARSFYPDFIGRFFTLAKKFSVEMLVLICDPVVDRMSIEPTFKLEIDNPFLLTTGDIRVLLSFWPADPSNDPQSPVFTAAFFRCQHFILKLISQHRVRDDPYTAAETQSTKTVLTTVDANIYLVCSYATAGRSQKDTQVITAVTELASVFRCKSVFQTLKDACLP